MAMALPHELNFGSHHILQCRSRGVPSTSLPTMTTTLAPWNILSHKCSVLYMYILPWWQEKLYTRFSGPGVFNVFWTHSYTCHTWIGRNLPALVLVEGQFRTCPAGCREVRGNSRIALMVREITCSRIFFGAGMEMDGAATIKNSPSKEGQI
jgi:hypothetical protein